MNTLDNLLLFIFIAVLLFYCYKKKKFIFSKLKKKETAENTGNTPINNIVPMPIQNMGMFSQMYPYLHGMPTGSPTCATYCKIIGVDSTVIENDADLEHVINTELSKLSAMGFSIQNVNVFVSDTTDIDAVHISFCITYGK